MRGAGRRVIAEDADFDEMAEACQDLWMGGVRGEALSFARAQSSRLAAGRLEPGNDPVA